MEDFLIGLLLSLGSCLLIGTSYILKKKALIRLAKKSIRAGDGGYGYLKEPIWWCGLLMMGMGEAFNFSAYAFAPATLITPLGALSVLVSNIWATQLMGETMNILGKIGCVLCLLGSTIVVFHSPKEQAVTSISQLGLLMLEPSFVVFSVLVITATVVLIFYYAPRYGRVSVIVYISICSLLGSFTVIGCKAIGVAIKETAGSGPNQFLNGLTWFFIFELAVCVAIQMNYLNRALDTFSMTVVAPVFYVFFTSSVIIGSAILFQEWKTVGFIDMAGTLSGFLVIVSGIYLLNAFKDLKINATDFIGPSAVLPTTVERDQLQTPLLPMDDVSLSDASSLLAVASPPSPETNNKPLGQSQTSWVHSSLSNINKTAPLVDPIS